MRNLISYSEDPFTVFEGIVRSKENPRKDILISISEDIRLRYNQYWSNRYNLALLSSKYYNYEIREALLHCYNGETNTLNEMLALIRRSQFFLGGTANKCQYCNINVDATMDHYLPKEEYPEFAVYALNLVPCCSECNTFKGRTFLVNGVRQFVNFYFDNIPNRQFLKVNLVFKEEFIPVATYYIEEIPEISEELTAILNNHFEKLQLNRRYSECAAEVISEHIRSIEHNNLIGNEAMISELLHIEAEKYRRLFGPNFWKSVLTDKLADSDKFLKETVPAFIENPHINIYPNII